MMKPTKKVALLLLVVLCLSFSLTGCGSGAKTLKIANVNTTANTFDFVDTATKETIAYDKLMLLGREVLDHECVSAMSGGVAFAVEEGQIVREGNKTSLSGLSAYSTSAELEYELKDGVLSITKMTD